MWRRKRISKDRAMSIVLFRIDSVSSPIEAHLFRYQNMRDIFVVGKMVNCRCADVSNMEILANSTDTDDVQIIATSKCWKLCQDVKIKTEILDEIENFTMDHKFHRGNHGKMCDETDSIEDKVKKSELSSSEDCVKIPLMRKYQEDVNFDEYVPALMNGQLLTCTVCRVDFPDETKFRMHMIGHSHGKLFRCRICGKQFSRSLSLRHHLRVHITRDPLECKHCNRRFEKEKDLNSHHAIAHSRSKSFECTICNAAKLRVSAVKPFECTVCKKKFLRSSSLRAHTIVHTADAPYECDVCSAKFKRSSVLKTHKLRHTGVRRFECDICKHRFHLKGALKHHILAHYGVRPYKCKDCGKRYRRSWGLKVHTYRHTGIKRFECDYCKSRFSVKTKLAKHIYGHVGEKPYKCVRCGLQYGERYLLKNHKCTISKEVHAALEKLMQTLSSRSKARKDRQRSIA